MIDYPLVEIVEHRSSAEAAEVVAEEAAAWLGLCCFDGGATVALPGGRSPTAMLANLASQPIAWPRVTVTTTDERVVPGDHALSNMRNVRQAFAGKCGEAATFVGLDRRDAHLSIRIPFDLCILGMGADGHIASLFPGQPSDGPGCPAILELVPFPLPDEAPVPRRSWSLSILAASRRTLLVCSGDKKRRAFERALKAPDAGPLSALISRAHAPVTIHWAEE